MNKKRKRRRRRGALKRKGHLHLTSSGAKINGMRSRKQTQMQNSKKSQTFWGQNGRTLVQRRRSLMKRSIKLKKKLIYRLLGRRSAENEAMKLLEEEQKQKTAMELLEQYLQFKQEAQKDKKKSKKERDPLKPKQPTPAFFLYSTERRAALIAQNKSVMEVAKIAGEEWKSMTENQRGPYEEMAKKNKEKYLQEMEVYKQKKDEEALNLKMEDEEKLKIQKHEALQMLKKKEKTENIIKKTKENRQKKKKQKENADPNKPKKPASSFLLFSKEARKNLLEERPGINNSTLNALISVKWKELSEQEKQIWNDKAAGAMEAHKKELEEYNKKCAAAMDHKPQQ
ncbi:hypothetical protein L1049_023190 [Liquidambar formosana]|uniref:HMG box domain-containing protein n=1 Tax=Liquidambar formosana TaxID=63359 RepID=A0AAP0RDR3_LIQFO